jgi:hypothetical protein
MSGSPTAAIHTTVNAANSQMMVRVFISASPPSEADCERFQFVRVFLQVLGNGIVDEVPSVTA